MQPVTRPVLHLHVGAMKTGTTYLQELMVVNRDALAEAGFVFVGPGWSRQVRAVQDLLHLDQHDPQIAALSAGAWDELVAEVRGRRDAASLVSMEFLSFTRRRRMTQVVRDLRGVEVHVVLTVRDVTSTIPAQWQTSITSKRTHTWEEFQAGVQRAASPVWAAHAVRGDTGVREFRRTQDVARMLRTWGRLVPPERLTVVTVPVERRDPDELWQRFATAIGVDPAVATEPPSRSNPSLGHASTELVRRLNVTLEGTLPWDYNRTVKSPLATRFLGNRRAIEERAHLDAATARFAADWNRSTREAIVASGAQVVGDLDDLPVEPAADTLREAAHGPDAAAVLDAARDAWSGLTTLHERRRRRIARLGDQPRPDPVDAPVPDWVGSTGGTDADLDRAVVDLTTLVRTLMRLRREMMELTTDETDDADEPDSA